jgi:hypothetical protein
MVGSFWGEMIKELKSNYIAGEEAGSESSPLPPSEREHVNGYYLMLISWASISSVVVIILELAW